MKITRWTAIIHTLFALLLLAGIARADWTSAEIGKEVSWELIHMLDWGTTLDIADRPDEYREVGLARAFIGDHPSRGEVNIYMGISAVLHPVATHLLPNKAHIFGVEWNPRAWWQNITIIGSGACVVNNFGVGLRLDF
jgi:hypothetical protein